VKLSLLAVNDFQAVA